MKFFKINDNLHINIEAIYSVSKHFKQLANEKYAAWVNIYNKRLEELQENPPLLKIKNTVSDTEDLFEFSPKMTDFESKEIYMKHLKEYINTIQKNIISEIGEAPEKTVIEESYQLILVTGVKVNIDKIIYDKLVELEEK